ncbi:glutaredoxin 2 [Cronobacter dublinensis]|uniref:glutaredoxin 2 n=1 Tax=Cronobacter dublinensis TaxID=413497 RepID=UPI00300DCA1B
MKLHIYEHCPFCVRALMIFGLKKLPVAVSVIMEGDAQTPTRMVGRKVVPILEKEDGTYMPESMDIVRYVDGLAAPRVADAPIDEAVKQWCESVSGPLFNLVIPRFTEGDFAELATPEARRAYTAREEKAFGDLDALRARTPALLEQVNAKLAALEPLVAERHTVDTTDFILFPLLRSLTIVKGAAFGPQAQAYLARVSAQTQVALLSDQAK